MRNSLHIISTEMLLWALGGFAPSSPVEREHGSYKLSASQIREILNLAAKPKCSKGEVLEMAERMDIKRNTLAVYVYRTRRLGYLPAYWREANGG